MCSWDKCELWLIRDDCSTPHPFTHWNCPSSQLISGIYPNYWVRKSSCWLRCLFQSNLPEKARGIHAFCCHFWEGRCCWTSGVTLKWKPGTFRCRWKSKYSPATIPQQRAQNPGSPSSNRKGKIRNDLEILLCQHYSILIKTIWKKKGLQCSTFCEFEQIILTLLFIEKNLLILQWKIFKLHLITEIKNV